MIKQIINGTQKEVSNSFDSDAVQRKTLDTPIIIDGVEQTTLEGAIDALAEKNGEAVTVSGNPLSFTTKSSQVASKTVITLEPIQAGSGDPSPSNVRAISGYGKVEVVACGKNLCDNRKNNIGKYPDDTGNWVVDADFASSDYISIAPNETYSATLYDKNGVNINSLVITTWDVNKNLIQQFTTSPFIAPSNAKYAIIRNYYADRTYINDNNFVFQLRLSSTTTSYEPYNPATDLSISLPGTIYGGTLDVESGELVVNRSSVTFDGSSDEGWSRYGETNMYYITTGGTPSMEGTDYHPICNRFKYTNEVWLDPQYWCFSGHHIYENTYFAVDPSVVGNLSSFTTWLGNNPVTVVRYLATPIIYHLTPHQVKLLQGANVVTCNGTTIQLTYNNGESANLSDLAGLADSINANCKVLTKVGKCCSAYVHGNNLWIKIPTPHKLVAPLTVTVEADGYIVNSSGSSTSLSGATISATPYDDGVLLLYTGLTLNNGVYCTDGTVSLTIKSS